VIVASAFWLGGVHICVFDAKQMNVVSISQQLGLSLRAMADQLPLKMLQLTLGQKMLANGSE